MQYFAWLVSTAVFPVCSIVILEMYIFVLFYSEVMMKNVLFDIVFSNYQIEKKSYVKCLHNDMQVSSGTGWIRYLDV